MSNVTTTFDTTEINSKVADLKGQMNIVGMKIQDMNDSIRNAPLEGNTLSSELRVMADTLTRAHQKLESLFNECQSDIMEASGNLDARTRIMEQTLNQ